VQLSTFFLQRSPPDGISPLREDSPPPPRGRFVVEFQRSPRLVFSVSSRLFDVFFFLRGAVHFPLSRLFDYAVFLSQDLFSDAVFHLLF